MVDSVSFPAHFDIRGSELLVPDLHARVTILDARGVPGQGLQGRLRLTFDKPVHAPIVLGRTRFLGGGLFLPNAG
mgnify:CR=1 FL=1